MKFVILICLFFISCSEITEPTENKLIDYSSPIELWSMKNSTVTYSVDQIPENLLPQNPYSIENDALEFTAEPLNERHNQYKVFVETNDYIYFSNYDSIWIDTTHTFTNSLDTSVYSNLELDVKSFEPDFDYTRYYEGRKIKEPSWIKTTYTIQDSAESHTIDFEKIHMLLNIKLPFKIKIEFGFKNGNNFGETKLLSLRREVMIRDHQPPEGHDPKTYVFIPDVENDPTSRKLKYHPNTVTLNLSLSLKAIFK